MNDVRKHLSDDGKIRRYGGSNPTAPRVGSWTKSPRFMAAWKTQQQPKRSGGTKQKRLRDGMELAAGREPRGMVGDLRHLAGLPQDSYKRVVARAGMSDIDISGINPKAYDTYLDMIGGQYAESIVPGRMITGKKGEPINYYADPLTLDTYNTIIENSEDPDSLPPWLPKEGIQEAYKFLAYTNKGKSVEDWSIDKTSDVYNFLSNLESPPASMLFPHQYMNDLADEEYRRKYNAGGMDNLSKLQKLLMSPFYSQPWMELPKQEMTREQKNKMLGRDVGGSILAALTTAPMAAIAVGTIAGVKIGTLMLPFIAVMAAANFADRQLELDSPGLASVNAFAGNVLNALSRGSEQIYGTLELAATDEEFKEVLNGVSEYSMSEYAKSAWQASQMRWDVMRESTILDIAGGQRTDPDEIWRIEQGVPNPVKVDKSWKWGKEATNAIQDELLAGAEVDEVISHWEEEFGFQGVLSDLVMQNIVDPLNVLPMMSNRIPRAIANGKVSKVIKAMDAAGDFAKLAKAMDYADDASDINKFIDAFSKVDSAELIAKLQATPEGADFLKIYGKMDDMRLAGNIVKAADNARGNAFIDAMPFPVNMVAGSIYKLVKGESGSYGGAAAVFENLKKIYTDGYAQDAARQIVTKGGKVKNFYAPPTWSPIERWLGGIDKSGMPSWATPTILPEGSGLLKKISIYLGSQTNSSKAIKFAQNMMTHVSGMMTGLKAEDQVGILYRMGMLEVGDGAIKIEAKLNGLRKLKGEYIPLDADLGEVFGTAMQRIEIDPAVYGSQASFVFRDAIRKAISKGLIGNEFQKWIGTTDSRAKLNQMANALGIEPNKVLDYVEKGDTATLWKKFKGATAEEPIAGFDRFYAMGDGDATSSIDTLLKIFTWDAENSRKMPWNDELFHVNLLNKLSKHVGEYATNRYMLTEKSAITKLIRYTNIQRQIQGALVLGLNPRYAIYNAINNIVTRVASDNFGYMRLTDIDNYNKRMGFASWNDAIDFGDWKFEGEGMDIQKTKIKIDDINYKFEHEWMEKLARGANAVSIFKKLSNNIESAHARKSYMNGLKKYWDNTWAGAIPGMDNINLPSNVKKSIMAKVIGSLNMDEVRTGIFKGNPEEIDINIYTRRVAENMAKDTILTPEILSEIIDDSVLRALKTELAGARTEGDVARAIERVQSGNLDFIRRAMDEDFKTRGADIQARMKDSGAYTAAKEYVDMQMYHQMEHIAHFRAIDAAISSMEGMTYKQRSKVWDGIELSENKRFKVLNKWLRNSEENIFGAVAELDPGSKARYDTHLTSMSMLEEMWRRFYKKRGTIWRKTFTAEYVDVEAKNLAFDAARLEVDGLADTAYDFEMRMYDRSANALFGGGTRPPVAPDAVGESTGIKAVGGEAQPEIPIGSPESPYTYDAGTLKRFRAGVPVKPAYRIGEDVFVGVLHVDAINAAKQSGGYDQPDVGVIRRLSDGKEFGIVEDGDLGFYETSSGKFLTPEESRAKYDVASSKEFLDKYPLEDMPVDSGLPRGMTIQEVNTVQQANRWFKKVGDNGLVTSEKAWKKGTAGVLTEKLEAMGIKTKTKFAGGEEVYVEISENDWEMIKDLASESQRIADVEGVEIPYTRTDGSTMPESHIDAVKTWLEHVKNARKDMIEAVRAHRKKMIDDPPTSYGDRLARNSKFYNEDYTKLIMELHNAEIEGAMFAVSSKGRVPSQINNGSITKMEAYMNHLKPMLDGIGTEIANDIRSDDLYDGSKLTTGQANEINSWLNQVDQNMRSNKFQAVKYGEAMKDYTMLDYTHRTGWDEAYSVLFPYQFWYTHSFRNWAMRTLDNTSMFSSFYRLRDAQKQMGKIGVPSRMENKLRLPWAFLPEWAGGSTYFDPYSQFFPPSSLFSMLDVFNDDKSQLYRTAYYHLSDMAKLGEITEEQAMKARETGEGDEWDMALEWANTNTGFSDPYTLASQFMQPAMNIDIGINLLKGTPEEIPPTPILNLSREMKSMVGEDTAAGTILGAPAWAEGKVRQAYGMTPAQAQFGSFGDYYVKRQLAGMMTMSEISPENYSKTLLDMQNGKYDSEWYKIAYSRALEEVNMKQPGYLGMMAAKGGASLAVIGATTFVSMFPHGVITQGELEYRGHQRQNNRAWEIYNATGDKTAMNEFYDEHPEYRLRSNIFIDDPKLQAKSLLITNIWDLYTGLDKANQKIAIEAFGQEFQRAFFDDATKDEFSVELDTLARWAQMLGSSIPESIPEVQEAFLEEPVHELDMWDDQHAKDYGDFIKEREKFFPTWYVLQSKYYDLPENERYQFTRDFPQFQEYRDWKKDYLKKKPGISSVVESGSINYGTKDGLKGFLTAEEAESIPALLSNSLIAHFTFDQPLGAGALMLLEDMWITAGKPGKDFKRWLNYEIAPNYTLLVK